MEWDGGWPGDGWPGQAGRVMKRWQRGKLHVVGC